MPSTVPALPVRPAVNDSLTADRAAGVATHAAA